MYINKQMQIYLVYILNIVKLELLRFTTIYHRNYSISMLRKTPLTIDYFYHLTNIWQTTFNIYSSKQLSSRTSTNTAKSSMLWTSAQAFWWKNGSLAKRIGAGRKFSHKIPGKKWKIRNGVNKLFEVCKL